MYSGGNRVLSSVLHMPTHTLRLILGDQLNAWV